MTLHEFNTLEKHQLREELKKCCGSAAWVDRMTHFIPAEDLVELLEDAEEEWFKCSEEDWKEAFGHHPRIGDMESLRKKFASTAEWASGEQSGVRSASQQIIEQLAAANKSYEEKFGYIFIICASGKSAEEMLAELETRLQNAPEVEIQVAAEEQNKITQLRLEKLIE
jgi:2-oxo-4-hydroxy-4-carboxy-5-ureidoimidazoline decarboxylase